MENKIHIPPIRKFTRSLSCVPDKSITHRALMFNAAANGKSEVRGMLLGEDCLSTVDCMRRMGAEIEICGDTARITGSKLHGADLYCGNSGTTMRLLCGLLSAQNGQTFTLSGDDSLSSRPMRRVIAPLESMGAVIDSQEGKAPLTVRGGRLHGIDYRMPLASAQVKSALILAALSAEGDTRIVECERTRDHSEILLRQMGADVRQDGLSVRVRGGQTLSAVSVTVAGDISSAAFPLVCGLITGGTVTVRNVGLNPTRTGILSVFDQIGADYEITDQSNDGGEPVGTVTVRSLGAARPYTITRDMIPLLVDEIPVLAVLACCLSGSSVVTGAEELRVKESDRIAATVRMLRAFGGKAEESADGMVIEPTKLQGGVFDPKGDHRMAMSAAVALSASVHGGVVLQPACAAVSYPNFWEMLLG